MLPLTSAEMAKIVEEPIIAADFSSSPNKPCGNVQFVGSREQTGTCLADGFPPRENPASHPETTGKARKAPVTNVQSNATWAAFLLVEEVPGPDS